ncbi:MAG: two-component system, OmpR family, sensor histidine kinase VicK [Thermoanaerobaculia bacterium]|jgi:PAS domain S-box-containing protein|nr:two-component system, OmpR family, sensor histidine kinase VicK [Thermoanaerobaculia bacterium]
MRKVEIHWDLEDLPNWTAGCDWIDIVKRLYQLFVVFAAFELLIISGELFLQQQALNPTMQRRYEYAVAVLGALSITAAVLYGRRLSGEVLATCEREKFLGQLQASEDELRRLNTAFEQAMTGIAFLGSDGCFKRINRSFATALGYEPDELLAISSETLVQPADIEATLRSNGELRETGKSEIEIRALRKGGSTIDVRLLRVASYDQEGNFLGHYAFAQDITEQKRAVAALHRSEERFLLAARATNDVVFDWDTKTNACWCNEAMAQFGSGVSGDVDQTVWSDAIHPDDAHRVLTTIQASIASGAQIWSDEYRFRNNNGSYADVFSRGYIVHSAAGEPLRMIGVTTDVTERKRAEHSYNTQILNAAADGIFGLDAAGHTTFVNESAVRLLGWSADELIGRNVHDIAHHHLSDGTAYAWTDCPVYITLHTGEAEHDDREVFWRKDGTTIAVEHATTPIRDAEGKVTGAVVTFRDVSERRAIEKMKDEFVSIVSHELRTPLTSIRGALGLLAGGRLGAVPAMGKRMLDIAVSNTERLVQLINDILDFERMGSGQVTTTRESCDSYQLMNQAIELIRPMAEKAEVTLQCLHCDVPLWADPDQILQTFSNLLSNAVKFSPAGSVVSLSAAAGDTNVTFEVADHGRGIPADKLDLIFERFQQADASDSREKGGTGLGLAICRSIVHQHGGDIHAESTLGEGSRFRFTIPSMPAMTTETRPSTTKELRNV